MIRFFICISILCFSIQADKLTLTRSEKNNIKKAISSGTTLYALKPNAVIYDLIDNKNYAITKPAVAKFFNEPSLSGHRFMSTNGKVRYLVDIKYLYDATQVTNLRPIPQDFKTYSGKRPQINVGAPFE